MYRPSFKAFSWILIFLLVTGIFLIRGHKNSARVPEISTQAVESKKDALTLPRIDNRIALEAARNSQKHGIYRFAESIPVQITPLTHGSWETLPSGDARWTLEVESPGASSLNFGFSRYSMPEGGRLTILKPDAEPEFRSFTSADNETHGELWTPILRGDAAVIRLDIAEENRDDLALELASVNHGFRSEKIGGDTSGSCNIDVNCRDLPGGIGEMVEMFADQIRSVGAYTLNGTDTCTGALINNTANDRRPFFLTADHCGINAGNAASMVVFWNFENSTCRAPDSPESGIVGDGDTSQFNSGAIFRAGNSITDFTLVELDDPIANEVDAFYAGWDRTGAAPGSAIGIHHPRVAEKRISFSFTPTETTSRQSNTSSGDGNYIRLVSWDNGTTERGSSGSPLFDPSGRIIGQLWGGSAACGNTLPDWYGRISRSWDTGGTPATRLSDWLDPTGSGVTTLDGIGTIQELAAVGNSGAEDELGTITFTVSLSEPRGNTAAQMITVDYTTIDGSAEAGTDYNLTAGTLSFAPGETAKTVSVPIFGDSASEENETFELRLSNPQPGAAAFVSPAPAIVTIFNDDFIAPVFDTVPSTTGTIRVPLTFQVTARNTPTQFGLLGTVPQGMRINPTSGLITWTPQEIGQVNVTLSATNPVDTATTLLTIDISENPLFTAIDNTTLSLGQGIGPSWGSQSAVTFDGIDAIQSAPTGDNRSSEFVVETEGEGALEFYWRVSSETGFDFLSFIADGEPITQITGDTSWQRYVLKLGPGPHRFAWRYQKNVERAEGSDAGWLDAVKFATEENGVVLFSIADVQIPAGAAYAQRIEYFPPGATLSAEGLPSWLSLSDDDFLTGTPPAGDSNTQTITLTATRAGTTSTTSFDITTRPTLDFADEAGSGAAITFFSGADTPWRSASGGDSGNTSIRSGAIGDDASSTISASITGPATLSFALRTSSEEGFDRCLFILDSTTIFSISGDLLWETYATRIPAGRHKIDWRYIKDVSESKGEDEAYLDSVSLSGYGAWIALQPVNGFTDPSYDPDWDRRLNFMEYALGTNPATTDPSPRLTYDFEASPPTMNLEKPPGVERVFYSLETSTDLTPDSWTNAESETITNDDTSFRAMPTNTPPRIFMRLNAQSEE